MGVQNYTPEATIDSDTASTTSSAHLGHRSLVRVSKMFQRKPKPEDLSKRSPKRSPKKELRKDLNYYPEQELADYELGQQMWVYGSGLMTPF
ncbi:hypothetical protein NDN08_007649 [Rhodosorus marinus]|uniref:Uncharacterized protein n=1 Tax=Rhodosorus marinus TaxID=101924 RepID=A0AAV8V2A5_9RHOD|nr:hypothetical protein NDN08_007649 [Rhodosorus marinus]